MQGDSFVRSRGTPALHSRGKRRRFTIQFSPPQFFFLLSALRRFYREYVELVSRAAHHHSRRARRRPISTRGDLPIYFELPILRVNVPASFHIKKRHVHSGNDVACRRRDSTSKRNALSRTPSPHTHTHTHTHTHKELEAIAKLTSPPLPPPPTSQTAFGRASPELHGLHAELEYLMESGGEPSGAGGGGDDDAGIAEGTVESETDSDGEVV